jgi:hypothetical protein
MIVLIRARLEQRMPIVEQNVVLELSARGAARV